MEERIKALEARLDYEESLNDGQAIYNLLLCVAIFCEAIGLLMK